MKTWIIDADREIRAFERSRSEVAARAKCALCMPALVGNALQTWDGFSANARGH